MKYYIDEHGYSCAEAEQEHHLIAWFLNDDIQGSLYSVNNYLSACDSVKNGQIPKWEGTGNAHTVIIEPNGVEIVNEYTEENLKIATIEEFKDYLDKWKDLLLRKDKH
ncbi:YacL family protein [Xenorhabdus sp. PB30.3]|uniref:YacL family protein n=1 Tax=Xenorhabdus sp. PB30.3 TaxID=2788941 RepID=UPI001E61D72F|nr:YacL family protein [Xenorhabdus sp. PB30.3]MCC8380459.1 YacL family protein [Xenorhabdus sp. PB30.3]